MPLTGKEFADIRRGVAKQLSEVKHVKQEINDYIEDVYDAILNETNLPQPNQKITQSILDKIVAVVNAVMFPPPPPPPNPVHTACAEYQANAARDEYIAHLQTLFPDMTTQELNDAYDEWVANQ